MDQDDRGRMAVTLARVFTALGSLNGPHCDRMLKMSDSTGKKSEKK